MAFKVIAECIDHRDGRRLFPGDIFPNPDKDQAERLVNARCLEEVSNSDARKAEKEAAAKARAEEVRQRQERIAVLDKMTDEQLAEEAKARGIDTSNAKDRAAVVALIAG